MKPWLIIPVKPFDESKSRLTAVLSPSLRAELSARLLERTLRTALDSAVFAQIVVVSRDPAALAMAAAFGAMPLVEDVAELNAALRQARMHAEAGGADAVLILPTDLARLRAGDLSTLVQAFSAPDAVVIAPSRDNGTNALMFPLPGRFEFAYGPDSCRIHQTRAEAAGLTVRIVNAPTLSFDLDSPADLDELSLDEPAPIQALLHRVAR